MVSCPEKTVDGLHEGQQLDHSWTTAGSKRTHGAFDVVKTGAQGT